MNNIAIAIMGFVGFAIGRIGDKYLGYVEKLWIFPNLHHWVWGAVLAILGYFWSYYILSFGIGLFISDLNDFLHARIAGKEPPHQWSFWSIQ
jgi:hypothetical protein